MVDASGQETHYIYDDMGRLTSETDASGMVITYDYDEAGNITHQVVDYESKGTGRNVTTDFTYDAEDNMLSVQTIADGIVNYEQSDYDIKQRPSGSVDALGYRTNVIYDSANHVTGIKNADDKLWQYTYTPNRKTETFTDRNGTVNRSQYDGYDRLGNRSHVTRSNSATNKIVEIEYNAFGLPIKQTEDVGGLNATTSYVYDNALRLVSMTNANDETTEYEYDELNQITAEKYPDGTTVRFTYDDEGNLLTRTTQDDEIISYTYDAIGRMTQRGLPDGSYQTYEYDKVGRVIYASSHANGHASELRYAYDAIGNPISSTQTLDGQTWLCLKTRLHGKPPPLLVQRLLPFVAQTIS